LNITNGVMSLLHGMPFSVDSVTGMLGLNLASPLMLDGNGNLTASMTQGPVGPTGPQGPQGPQGAPGTGALPSTALPQMNGTALAGVSGAWSPGDHVHPVDASRVAKAGDTMTGYLHIAPPSGTNADIFLDKAAGQAAVIQGTTAGSPRWNVIYGDSAAETGSNVGSDFYVQRLSDAGAFIDSPIAIKRSTGSMTLSADLFLTSAGWTSIHLNKPSGSVAQIVGTNNNVTRWVIAPGTSDAETGSNAGTHFYIQRFNDAGSPIDYPLYINRTNAGFQITGIPYCPGGGSWQSSSDARIKTVLGNYASGLRELIRLRPVNYFYKGNDTAAGPEESQHRQAAMMQTKFVGLVAQEAEEVMPELVKKRPGFIDGQAVTDFRDLDQTPLTFALINAVRELAARVVALEAICGIS
jgi:hypothetical protein